MIPKKIYTCWLSESDGYPPLIERCIKSQKIEGYEHHVLTLKTESADNYYIGWKGKDHYLTRAMRARKWVKATDYLRMWYLYNKGGFFLDADVEILDGKNFDHLLNHRMVAAREWNGFIGAAVIGAEKGYPFIKQWMEEVENNFRGDDDFNFESSMDILVRGYFENNFYREGFALVPTETFYPYNHQQNFTKITNDTVCLHHFMKSWVDKKEVIEM